MNTNSQLNLLQRIQAPTPTFFKKLRTAGMVLTGVSAALLAKHAVVSDVITQVAGYVAVAGSVLSAVSQTAVDDTARRGEEPEE